MPPKKILEVKILSAEEAQQLGSPSGKQWDQLFGTEKTVIGVFFEQVEPHEVPVPVQVAQKSAVTLGKIKENSTKAKVVEVETVLEGDAMETLFAPDPSRKVKTKKDESELKGREIHLSSNLLKKFKELAFPHSPNEFMGWILGTVETDKKTKQKFCYADGLFVPKQSGSNWQYKEEGESSEKLSQHLTDRGGKCLGVGAFPPNVGCLSELD